MPTRRIGSAQTDFSRPDADCSHFTGLRCSRRLAQLDYIKEYNSLKKIKWVMDTLCLTEPTESTEPTEHRRLSRKVVIGMSAQHVETVKSWTDRADRKVLYILEHHANLMAAILVASLCGWGMVTLHVWFVVGVIAVGAAAYLLGATVALLGALLLTVLGTHLGPNFNLDITTALFELVGYALVARLGYGHRKTQRDLQRKQRELLSSHPDQVIPWHVSNEVRTSLAAVRFLLFPVSVEHNGPAVEEAVKELSRLEGLFEQLEAERMQAQKTDLPRAGAKLHSRKRSG